VIELSQTEYILTLLERYGMKNCNRATTPSEISSHCSTTKSDQISNSGEWPYCELISILMYLVTRFNIANIIRCISLNLLFFSQKNTFFFPRKQKQIYSKHFPVECLQVVLDNCWHVRWCVVVEENQLVMSFLIMRSFFTQSTVQFDQLLVVAVSINSQVSLGFNSS